MAAKYKSMTLRLPQETYDAVKAAQKTSVTAYILEAVEAKVEQDREDEIARSLALLVGETDQETTLWMGAQREAMKYVD
jgi:hypothetical protein